MLDTKYDINNHNEIGNPHSQYVGTNKTCFISNNTYRRPYSKQFSSFINPSWKFAEVTFDSINSSYSLLNFDIIICNNGNSLNGNINISLFGKFNINDLNYKNGINRSFKSTLPRNIYIDEAIEDDKVIFSFFVCELSEYEEILLIPRAIIGSNYVINDKCCECELPIDDSLKTIYPDNTFIQTINQITVGGYIKVLEVDSFSQWEHLSFVIELSRRVDWGGDYKKATFNCNIRTTGTSGSGDCSITKIQNELPTESIFYVKNENKSTLYVKLEQYYTLFVKIYDFINCKDMSQRIGTGEFNIKLYDNFTNKKIYTLEDIEGEKIYLD